jgi:ABC-type transport system substrate-binding protein
MTSTFLPITRLRKTLMLIKLRRIARVAGCVGVLLAACNLAAAGADPDKVLHIASPDIETLDPQQYNDSPSFDVISSIFEGLYEWEYLASPPKLAPLCAAAPPEITDGGKSWTIRVKKGIYFTDDTAFHGNPREVTADDFVYSLKRWLDPNLRRGGAPIVTDLIVGARAVVDAAAKPGGAFDYDRPIAGLRALDRYTLELKLNAPNFANIQNYLTTFAVAREVVDAAGLDIRTRAVGTGAFRLKEWKRGSKIVLEANPQYRSIRFPQSADSGSAALVRSMQGKTLPQIGSIEISVIEEDVARLLEFDRGHLDYVVLRGDIANRLLDNGKLKSEYADRGILRVVFPEPYLFSFYQNIADPVLGGMEKEHIALRRAIALALDTESLITIVYAGQAIAANQLVPPGVTGHDPSLLPAPRKDTASANALLDRFGYGKRDGNGFRRQPDGTPLTLTLTLRSGGSSREIETLWKRSMDAIGLRMEYHVTPFQDAIKELEGGKFQVFFGGYGGIPSGYAQLIQLYSIEPPTVNATRFKSADYDRAMETFLRSAEASEQIAAARKMWEIAHTYAPIVPAAFRLENDFVQPWLQGFGPQRFQTYWKYLDIDLARQRRMNAKH